MKPIFPGVSVAVASAMAQDDGAPQCQAARTTRYANDTRDTDKQCNFSARYQHDGRFYCSRHAAAFALAWMIEQTAARG